VATNQYFNNFPASGTPSYESTFIEDLVQEVIQIYGVDLYYLPRASQSTVDQLYGEDPVKLYNKAYQLEMLIENVNGPDGASEFFAKFMTEIKDHLRLSVARKTFNKYVQNLNRPREGDLIWVPFLNNLFEINFVEEDKDFHRFGRRPPYYMFFELKCELFKFSNEVFQTGVPDVDNMSLNYNYTITLNMNSIPTISLGRLYFPSEYVYQGANLAFSTASATVKAWDQVNNIIQLVNVKGVMAPNVQLVGNTTNAVYLVSSSVNREDFSKVTEEIADNITISEEANNILDWTETNPFGNP
jgi:hypothetical protein